MEEILFKLSGIVKKGAGRGKSLGFPTANIMIPSDMPEGIFIGYAALNDIRYPALIFIGSPLTFGETDKKAEVYILDFDQYIYGEFIEAEAVKKIRDNQKFDSQEALVIQIKQDEREARNYFKFMEGQDKS